MGEDEQAEGANSQGDQVGDPPVEMPVDGPLGELEHMEGDSPLMVPPETQPARRVYSGHPGQPLDYEVAAYGLDDSWGLLSKSMQDWAEERAGPAIRDPHSEQPTVYWYCRVVPTLTDGPAAAARRATYDLVMLGKRGLVTSTGTTANLDAEDGPRWRHKRYDFEIDPSGLRNDHHLEAAPSLALPASPNSGRNPGSGGDSADAAAALLPRRTLQVFGNLPLVTQQFLMEEFVRRGRRPAESNAFATTWIFGQDYREELWVYVFDGRRMGFAHAHRAVPWRSNLTGPALWSRSPEAEALRVAPWTVVAWTAPGAQRQHQASQPRDGKRSEGTVRQKDDDPGR